MPALLLVDFSAQTQRTGGGIRGGGGTGNRIPCEEISLLVQTTSGVSRVTRVDAFTVTTGTVAVTESEAVTLAVLIPLTRRK